MSVLVEHLSPRGSLFAGFDPRWKLASLLIAAAITAMLHVPRSLAAAVALALVLALAARVPIAWGLVRIRLLLLSLAPFLVILPLTVDRGGPALELFSIRLSSDGFLAATALLSKAIAITTLMLIVLTTSPFHVTLRAAQRLFAPRILILLTALSYRYIFLLRDELNRLRIAWRVRGFRNRANRHSYRTIGLTTGTLLIRGVDRAERISHAMRCRGFDGTFRGLDEFHTKKRDVVLFLLIVLCYSGIALAPLAHS